MGRHRFLFLNRIVWIACIGVVVCLTGIAWWILQPIPANKPPVTPETNYSKGTGPIVLTAYQDLECAYCKHFHQETYPDLVREFGDIFTLSYRHFPRLSRPQAFPEAIAAECAGILGGNEVFWKYVDEIFNVTASNNNFDLALLPALAERFDIERNIFETCRNSPEARTRVERDLSSGSDFGFTLAPSIIVSGYGKTAHVAGDAPRRLRTAIEYVMNSKDVAPQELESAR